MRYHLHLAERERIAVRLRPVPGHRGVRRGDTSLREGSVRQAQMKARLANDFKDRSQSWNAERIMGRAPDQKAAGGRRRHSGWLVGPVSRGPQLSVVSLRAAVAGRNLVTSGDTITETPRIHP